MCTTLGKQHPPLFPPTDCLCTGLRQLEYLPFSCIVVRTRNGKLFMPKRTYQPSQKKRLTTHGFLVRAASKTGAKILRARRRKGRAQLAVQKSR